eukprot:COSAG05_NODE_1100_length_5884_cov_7.338634_2_plen_207_part_00
MERTARILVAGRADVGLVNCAGRTPLHEAAAYAHTGLSQFLVESGSPVVPALPHSSLPTLHPAPSWQLEWAGGCGSNGCTCSVSQRSLSASRVSRWPFDRRDLRGIGEAACRAGVSGSLTQWTHGQRASVHCVILGERPAMSAPPSTCIVARLLAEFDSVDEDAHRGSITALELWRQMQCVAATVPFPSRYCPSKSDQAGEFLINS